MVVICHLELGYQLFGHPASFQESALPRIAELLVAYVLPDCRGTHAETYAERCYAVLCLGVQLEQFPEVRDEPSPGGRQRMAEGDGSAQLVQPLVLDAVHIERFDVRQALDRERLVELDEVEVVELEAGSLERLFGRGDWAQAHYLSPDTGIGEPYRPHLRLQAQLLDQFAGSKDRAGGSVVKA